LLRGGTFHFLRGQFRFGKCLSLAVKDFFIAEIVAGVDQRTPELKLSMNKQTAKTTKINFYHGLYAM